MPARTFFIHVAARRNRARFCAGMLFACPKNSPVTYQAPYRIGNISPLKGKPGEPPAGQENRQVFNRRKPTCKGTYGGEYYLGIRRG